MLRMRKIDCPPPLYLLCEQRKFQCCFFILIMGEMVVVVTMVGMRNLFGDCVVEMNFMFLKIPENVVVHSSWWIFSKTTTTENITRFYGAYTSGCHWRCWATLLPYVWLEAIGVFGMRRRTLQNNENKNCLV